MPIELHLVFVLEWLAYDHKLYALFRIVLFVKFKRS